MVMLHDGNDSINYGGSWLEAGYPGQLQSATGKQLLMMANHGKND